MPVPSPIPNTSQRKLIYAGTETVAGTAVTPTYKLYGDLVVNKETPIVDREEYAGTYDVDYTPTFDPPRIDGTYACPLSYEDLAILARYAVKGSVSGVSDAQPTPGYVYTYSPTASTDDVNTGTWLYNFEGIVFRSTGVRFNEYTIRGNIDDAGAQWMWDSRLYLRDKELQIAVEETTVTSATTSTLTKTAAAWTVNAWAGQYVEILSGPAASEVARIVSNTADTLTITGTWATTPTAASTFAISGEFTAAITDRTKNPINMAGTRLFIDEDGGTLGTRQVQGRFKAFSVTVARNLNPKRMAEDTDSYSAKVDVGMRRVTAQITMEYDDWREELRWEEHADRMVRIDQVNGPIIYTTGPTRMYAQINLPRMQWFTNSEERRNNNVLITYQGRGYVDTVLGYSHSFVAKNTLSVLP